MILRRNGLQSRQRAAAPIANLLLRSRPAAVTRPGGKRQISQLKPDMRVWLHHCTPISNAGTEPLDKTTSMLDSEGIESARQFL